jgi:hypothetical protein
MDDAVSIEDILNHVNQHLAPEDRVPEEEIARVGAQLKAMLTNAAPAYHQQNSQGSARPSLRTRLAAFWQALKEKLAALLAPLTPRWRKLIGLIREKLNQVEGGASLEALMGMVLIVVVVAVLAALMKSLPLLVALLALTGLMTFMRLLACITRLPGLL